MIDLIKFKIRIGVDYEPSIPITSSCILILIIGFVMCASSSVDYSINVSVHRDRSFPPTTNNGKHSLLKLEYIKIVIYIVRSSPGRAGRLRSSFMTSADWLPRTRTADADVCGGNGKYIWEICGFTRMSPSVTGDRLLSLYIYDIAFYSIPMHRYMSRGYLPQRISIFRICFICRDVVVLLIT